jgi:SPP1 gp7 family putative phage head morphogenesis protein
VATKEFKILTDAFNKIANQYSKAYGSLLKRIPSLVNKYYSQEKGFFEIQEIINQVLQPINEFGQIQVYDELYTLYYNEVIRQNKIAYGFQYNFSQVDQRAIDQLKSSKNWFVSKYQTLTDQQQTLKKMKELWKSGEPVKSVILELEQIFQKSNARINSYTKTTITTNSTRVRTTADLNNFSQNGITKYKYRAVVDNVTTEICEDLNGREYSLKKALDFQNKIDQGVSDIIRKGTEKGLPDWKIYNNAMKYLQDNDSFANLTNNKVNKWQTKIIYRTSDPLKQGKERVRNYKNLESVPGNKIPRPPLHQNCRSRLQPVN